jgi:3-deoxy-D-manno-octulosonic-acid transferase
MLVNGRISQKSFASYKRFRFFFLPMFRCFTLFSMQTAKDSDKMIELGIAPDKILTLGNLKYDMDITHNTESQLERFTLDIDAQPAIFICGSTHRGEEKIIFSAFAQLLKEHNLFLILAPRDISRGKELVQLAGLFGLKARTRSSRSTGGNVLILDTIGELASCYRLAQLAFVGGSLVDRGGHNPIEPAAFGVPVLFGRHMEDFSEIADELVEKGGARMVTEPTLTQIASEILTSNTVHLSMAEKALSLVRKHRGCMANHIQVIRQLLGD